MFDKPDPLDGPFFEETIYVTPSRHDPEVLAEVERLVTPRGVRRHRPGPRAGARRGAAHPRRSSRLLEVAARSIGGLCARSLRFGMLEQSLEVVLLRCGPGHEPPGHEP